MKNDTKGMLYAAVTALLWGFLAIALKVSLEGLTPVTVVWVRFATAFAMLSIFTLLFRPGDFSVYKKPSLKLILAGILLGFNYLGFISGIKYISPTSAQVFIMVGPVSFALSGIIIFKEKVNFQHIIGFILVVAGIALFYSEQIVALAEAGKGFTKGMLMIFGGGLSWAIYSSLQKDLVKIYSPNQLNLFIYSLAVVMFIPFIGYSAFPGLDKGDWFLLFFLGANTVFAYGALVLAIKYTEATKVSVIITLNPIITFVSMAILSRMNVSWIAPETHSPLSLVGAATVLAGAMTVIFAGRKK